jgi:hypothetical protein
LVVILPPFFLAIYLAFSVKSAGFLLQINPVWLVGLQTFRVVVEIVLWLLFLDGMVPVQMTFEGQNFDVLVGLTAPVMAYILLRNQQFGLKWGIAWNIMGLGLLFNIIITSILSTPAPFRVFMNEPANIVVAYLPFVWLPGFLVPLALALHLLSLKQLWLKSKLNQPERTRKQTLVI